MNRKIVAVYWQDANFYWRDALSFDEAMECQLKPKITFGPLIRKDREVVIVAGEVDGSDFRQLTVIPAGWVTKIVGMKESG